jgi:hypothetical protein
VVKQQTKAAIKDVAAQKAIVACSPPDIPVEGAAVVVLGPKAFKQVMMLEHASMRDCNGKRCSSGSHCSLVPSYGKLLSRTRMQDAKGEHSIPRHASIDLSASAFELAGIRLMYPLAVVLQSAAFDPSCVRVALPHVLALSQIFEA